MNTRPIVEASLTFTDDGVPYSTRYDALYHPRSGAFAQAWHVFIGGNRLPERWQGRSRFVVLETGFGLGHNFLATWQAWRDDPSRCERLVFISIEQSPFSASDLRRAHSQTPAPELSDQLIGQWPPLTHNLHCLDFEGGRVRLMLAFGDVEVWLPEVVAQVDAFYLDGFAPARNPRMWEKRIYKAMARLAAPDATLATWTTENTVRGGLQAAGFEIVNVPGSGEDRALTAAHFAPRFTPRPSRHHASPRTSGHALIVGAGLAGCSTAQALAAEGWTCTLYDQHAAVAQAASGNPAGLFHGIVTAHDGTHARFHRAAALRAAQVIGRMIQEGHVHGAVEGLLRLADAEPQRLRDTLSRLGLPPDYVQVLDAEQASQRAGMHLLHAAWYYPRGGWVRPPELARAWLTQAGAQARFCGGVQVDALRRVGDLWQLLDAKGHAIDEADTVVLTNAADVQRLLGHQVWPMEIIRGQLSHVERQRLPELPLPSIPVAGSGYLLPQVSGQIVFGATSQPGDLDASMRLSDHEANLAQLAELLGITPTISADALQGRVAWRATARDRLPWVGAVPPEELSGHRLEQPRWVPRLPGLYVHAALASRGITWSALTAQTIAAWITGAPAPLEASLIDAIDPARFVSREVRRQADASTSTED